MIQQKSITHGRLGYVDALRGFTMFLVVFNHVLYLSFGTESQTFSSSFFALFRMPMFFFISGFVGYKALEHWSLEFYSTRLCQKLLVQTIPALFFFTLYTLCQNGNPLNCLQNGFGGYWFTFVLLEMLLTYFTLSMLAHYTHRYVLDAGLVAMAMTLGYLSLGNRDTTPLQKMLSVESYMFFFQFFALGVFFRRYYGHVMKWLGSAWMSGLLIIAFISLCLTHFNNCFVSGWRAMLGHLSCRVTGLLCLFIFFARREAFFSNQSRISRMFRFVGRRTLDIYLIHFFFLPDLSRYAAWVLPRDQVLAQVFIGGSIATAIITLCLLCSELLRTSDVLAHYLLGVKKISKTTKT